MSSSPNWLAALERIREYRRDTALQSLAQSLRTATQIRDTTARIEAMIASLENAQQQSRQPSRLDAERMRQHRQDRDELRSQKVNLQLQQAAADADVLQAQADAAAKNAEADVLHLLRDRLDSAHRQSSRRQLEQSPLEVAISLCNGERSD
jgi:hypothetical protein